MNDNDYAKLQDIGRTAAECIAEMVAALECDYDRLAELREARDDMRSWLVRCDNGTYDARDPNDDSPGFVNHNLGNGRDIESALREVFAAHYPDDASELAELEAAAGDCEDRDDAEQRIHEDALSVEIRSGWCNPHYYPEPPDEFRILLSTGGPATQIIGELTNGEPSRARLQVQDWFLPWTDYAGDAVSEADLLAYCSCFYFGE